MTRKKIVEDLKIYRRRVEYCIFISALFILLGYSVEALKEKDVKNLSEIFVIMYRLCDDISLNIVPIMAVAAVIIVMLSILICPNIVKIVVGVLLTASILLICYCPNINIFAIRNWFRVNGNYLLVILFLCLIIAVYMKKKIVKIVFEAGKYIFEILFISSVCYFASIYRWNVVNMIVSYWKIFKRSVYYLKDYVGIAFLWYLIVVFGAIYGSTIKAVIFHKRNFSKKKKELKNFPTVGICIPAYNEEKTILKTIDSVLHLDYPSDKIKIVVVSDGSVDRTVSKVKERYKMIPFPRDETEKITVSDSKVKGIWGAFNTVDIRLIDKNNGGKYDALNVGFEYMKDSKYIMIVDADTVVSKDALKNFVVETVSSDNTVALSGTILPTKKQGLGFLSNALTQWQYLEYVASFHISRGALSLMNSMTIVSGAFGFFNREKVIEVGGYKKTLGEDMFLTLDLQSKYNKYKNGIRYVPEALAYTCVPTNISFIRRQRMRWFKGLTEAFNSFGGKLKKPQFFEFFLVEWATPIFAPYGLAVIIAMPSVLLNKWVQIQIMVTLLTPIIQSLIAVCIEAGYRKTSWKKLMYIPIQIVISPFLIIWRNDGLLDIASKKWGKAQR